MFFLAQPKASRRLRIQIADKNDIVGKIVDGFKQPRIRFSIWAVNGSQNEVLVFRKINVDYQGFVLGYDIEIYVEAFFFLFKGGGKNNGAKEPLNSTPFQEPCYMPEA